MTKPDVVACKVLLQAVAGGTFDVTMPIFVTSRDDWQLCKPYDEWRVCAVSKRYDYSRPAVASSLGWYRQIAFDDCGEI